MHPDGRPHALSATHRTKDQQTDKQGLTFRVGADEDSDAAAGGYEVRRQGGKVPGERRPPERGVPGTGQLGAGAGWPHRPGGGLAATTTSVLRVPDPPQPREGDAGTAAQSRSEPRAQPASSVALSSCPRAVAIRTLGSRGCRRFPHL